MHHLTAGPVCETSYGCESEDTLYVPGARLVQTLSQAPVAPETKGKCSEFSREGAQAPVKKWGWGWGKDKPEGQGLCCLEISLILGKVEEQSKQLAVAGERVLLRVRERPG